MSVEEKAAHDALITQIKADIEKAIPSAEIESLKTKITELENKTHVPADYETLKNEVVSLATEIKAMKESKTEAKRVESLTESLLKHKEQLLNLKEKKGSDINLTVKAVGTMSTANVTPTVTNGISVVLNDPETGLTGIPRSAPFFRELFSNVPTSGNTVSYAEMKAPEGGAGMTAEGALKSQADFDIVEASVKVKKVTAYIKTSKEALEDVSALAGEINNELLTLVNLKADSQLMIGDNGTNNLNGAYTQATTFAAGDFAGTIPGANNYDVLEAAITQIQTAEVISGEPAGFTPNVIVLNPIDIKKMKLSKDKNENYLFPVTLPGATSISEVPVVSNARMAKGTFLVMDSTKGNLRIREDVNINIGYENDDFTKNLVTILAEMRLAFYIKSNHTKAFVKGVFSTARAALIPA